MLVLRRLLLFSKLSTIILLLSLNAGYKIVFDNIDKNVKPRHVNRQTRSLHYVHAYAVKDHIDFSAVSNELRGEVNVLDVLPDCQD